MDKPSVLFENTLDANDPSQAYLLGHVVHGVGLFPFSGFVELICAAACATLGEDSVELTEVEMQNALCLTIKKSVKLQILLHKNGASQEIEVFRHARALISNTALPASRTVDPAEVRELCRGSEVDPATQYRTWLENGLDLDTNFRTIKSLSRNAEGEVYGELSLDSNMSDTGYLCHPSLLDGCFRVGAFALEPLGVADGASSRVVQIPTKIDRFILRRPLGESVAMHARPSSKKQIGDLQKVDLVLFDKRTGVICAEIEGLSFQALDEIRSKQILSEEDGLYYQVSWRLERTRSFVVPPQRSSNALWVIFADSKGLGDSLRNQLNQSGEEVLLVHADGDNATSKQAISQLFADLSNREIAGIIHMWGLDAEITDSQALDAAQQKSCGSLLHIVQALLNTKFKIPPRLVVTTCGAQALPDQPQVSVMQTPLVGLARVVALEHPELKCRLVDLDYEFVPKTAALALFDELKMNDSEDLVALRKDNRFVARLTRLHDEYFQSFPNSLSHQFKNDSTYIITGGLGGIGLETAAYLTDRGAQHLVLIGRRAPSPRASEIVDGLRAQGIEVVVYATDVSSAAAVEQTLVDIRQKMPPIAGIFHAAGALSDGVLNNQSWQTFHEVFLAKVYGAWNLHEATRADRLDHFVLFSSGTSLVGAMGQSNYAAANAFLDGLAHYRKALGLTALTINWGAWNNVGKAYEILQQRGSLAIGLNFFSPQQAFQALDRLLTRPDFTQVGLIAIDWQALQSNSSFDRPFFKEVFAQIEDGNAISLENNFAGMRPDLDVIEDTQNIGKLVAGLPVEQYVEKQVRAVLRWRQSKALDHEQGFFDMGMDSLMSLELSSRFKADLGTRATVLASTIFDYPTVALLSQFIGEQLVPVAAAAAEQPASRMVPEQEEGIAIIGLSCRFPGGADSPDKFWQLLVDGVNCISPIPKDRWDIDKYYDPDPDAPGKMHVNQGGFLKEPIDLFDEEFFSISPREAEWMGPQHRLLLEVTWEALENAGIDAAVLKGTATGVFIGVTTNDYLDLVNRSVADENLCAYTATGTSLSMVAGRLAYLFGLQGPCWTLDTACSSSLVAVHNACTSLLKGESDCAIAGGVNMMLLPMPTICCCKAGMLSADGKCKTFDASADGYVRAEGSGVVILKRLSDAKRDGDRILSVLRSTVINQDGASSGLTVPNGAAQERLIRSALQQANLVSSDIDMIEAHGTGTKLGDPIEANSLQRVFGGSRTSENPLVISSVKTNIGHLEGAAGVAGLIKTVLSLQNEAFPPHLHLSNVNPEIDLDAIPAIIPTTAIPWPRRSDHVRRAGVSSFGFSGTNVHAIVEEAPQTEIATDAIDRPWHLLTLSAKSESALTALIAQYISLASDKTGLNFADVAYTANVGRSHFNHKLAVIAKDLDGLKQNLLAGKMHRGVISPGTAKPKIAFLFTGQGSLYAGMGKELYETQPIFRASLDRVSTLFERCFNSATRPSLTEFLYNEHPALLLDPVYAQSAIFAIEYALAQLWKSFGVIPSVVIGHSLGEYALSVVAGVMTVESALNLVVKRALLFKNLRPGGGMAAFHCAPPQLDSLMKGVPNVEIAACNAPNQTVVSGSIADLEKLLSVCLTKNIRGTRLEVTHAFHSAQVAPILEDLFRESATHIYSSPTTTWISTVTGKPIDSGGITPDYWVQNTRSTVLFEQAIRSAVAEGCTVFIEIGPQPHLTSLAAQFVEQPQALWLPSMRMNTETWQVILESLAQLYVNNVSVDWSGFDKPYHRSKVQLPTYPFQRKRHWLKRLDQSAGRHSESVVVHPLLGWSVNNAGSADSRFENSIDINRSSQQYLKDHRALDYTVFPASAFAELLFNAVDGKREFPLVLEQFEIQQPLRLNSDHQSTVQVVVTTDGDGILNGSVYSQSPQDSTIWNCHSQAQISTAKTDIAQPVSWTQILKACPNECEPGDFYERLRKKGMEYGPNFQVVESLFRGVGQACGEVRLPSDLSDANYYCHPALLDGCLQITSLVFDESDKQESAEELVFLPVLIDKFILYHPIGSSLAVHAKAKKIDVDGLHLTSDLILFDKMTGQICAEIKGLTVKSIARNRLHQQLIEKVSDDDDLYYEVVWQPAQEHASKFLRVESKADSQEWIVFADRNGVGATVSNHLINSGKKVSIVHADVRSLEDTDTGLVSPACVEAIAKILDGLGGREIAGVVYLWGLNATSLNWKDIADTQHESCGGLVYLVQELEKTKLLQKPQLWLVTQGAEPAVAGEVAVMQSPLIGLGKVVAAEHPEFQCHHVDLDINFGAKESAELLFAEVCIDDDEDQVALRKDRRYVPKLRRTHKRVSPPLKVPNGTYEMVVDPAKLELSFQRKPSNVIGHGQIKVRVEAAGINFRDVLMSMGLYPGGVGRLGADFAGRVVELGEGVSDFKVGDAVIGMAVGAFTDHLVTDANLLVHKPENLSFAEAAALPSVFSTAHACLFDIARLKAGESVLVHAGAGGVGLVAIQIAKRLGATVYATAGSDRKRAYVKRAGADHVLDSRSLDFAPNIMSLTNGAGVDVVLNSLAGDFIPASLDVLKANGRFVEIGKRDIWTNEQVARAYPNVFYKALALDQEMSESPSLCAAYLKLMCEWYQADNPAPKVTTFPIDRASEAFRYIQQAKQIGKVVLTFAGDKSEHHFKSNGTYVVTGGLGGIGLEIIEYLVNHGAKHIAVLSRHEPSASVEKNLELLRSNGTSITTYARDVADRSSLEQTLDQIRGAMPPIKGLFHAAGVISDGILANQTWQKFSEVFAAKVHGGWHLHELTEGDNLDHFVLFSSAAALFGSASQSNYAAANAFLDGLAHYRYALGLPALSINWGAWSSVGLAAQTLSERGRAITGVRTFTASQAIRALDRLLGQTDTTQIAFAALDWEKLKGEVGFDRPWLSEIRVKQESSRAETADRPTATSQIVDQFDAAELTTRIQIVMKYVKQQVSAVLGWDDHERLNAQQGFLDLGMDSLMGVELTNRFKRDLGKRARVSAPTIFDHPTIERLSHYLTEQLQTTAPISNSSKPAVEEPTMRLAPSTPAVKEPAMQLAQSKQESVAVIGIGCRFPGGANDPDAFWQLLSAGVDAISPVPNERWNAEEYYAQERQAAGKMYVREGGFLTNPIDRFDEKFFGISAREAEWIDPQQRLLLEVAWESLENSGIDPASLRNTSTGVFIGVSSNDYVQMISRHSQFADVSPYLATGNSNSLASGRLSYVLGLQGPAITIDTACSSSLVAVNNASTSLLSGDSDCAIAGGVNLMISPAINVAMCASNMLSSDARCKTFDAGADGFIRGEGCGLVVLKRLSDAERDGDRILAVIKGSSVNQDGASSGLTAPNGLAQEAVIRRSLKRANVEPRDIDVIEAHGTATPLGDPIEVDALRKVFSGSRADGDSLALTSVKTNVGHLEAAAGIAGLIKVVLSLQNEMIPAHLHLRNVSPELSLEEIPAIIHTKSTPWLRRADRVRRAGISSFGFSGTNVHMIVEEAALSQNSHVVARPWHLVTISAKSEPALLQQIDRYADYIRNQNQLDIADIAFTANVGRGHFSHSAIVLAQNSEQLISKLCNGDYIKIVVSEHHKPNVAFVLNGQKSIGFGACRQLYESQQVFQAAIDYVEQLFAQHEPSHLLTEALYGDSNLLADPLYADSATFAVTLALCEMWKSFGVTPDALIGHGPGELALAVVAGTMSVESALSLVMSKSYSEPRVGEGIETSIGEDDIVLWLPSPAKQECDWSTILETVAQLYARGVKINWHNLDAPFHRKKIQLPTYAFQRSRHWLDLLPQIDLPQGKELDDFFYEIAWRPQNHLWHAPNEQMTETELKRETILKKRDSFLQDFDQVHLLTDRKKLRAEIESVCHAFVCRALVQLGVGGEIGEKIRLSNLRASVLGQHVRVIEHCLQKLTEAEILERAADDIWIVRSWKHDDSPLFDLNMIVKEHPEISAEASLLGRCAESLADVWQGAVDPLSLLFSSNNGASAEDLYYKSKTSQLANVMMQQTLETIFAQLPAGKTLRILEIGAGTGGTTHALLPHLIGKNVEYVFTDISQLFLENAKERFEEFPFVQYSLLDIELDPKRQGFAPAQFDLIIAANVLHATKDLAQSLQHVRHLLVPGGYLTMREGVAPQLWLDLTFGLLEGWWRFSDRELRPDYPLLAADSWKTLLQEQGFDFAESVSSGNDEAIIVGQAKSFPLITKLPQGVEQKVWLVLVDCAGFGDALSQSLRDVGEETLVVNNESSESISRVFETTANRQIIGVIDCRAIDAKAPADCSLDKVQQSIIDGALDLVRAVNSVPQRKPRLWFVTKGAQALPGQTEVEPMQGTLIGLSRSVALEHPALKCTSIDLDSRYEPIEAADLLLGELLLADKEDQIALRDHRRFVSRLCHQNAQALAESLPVPSGAYRLALSGASGDAHFESTSIMPPEAGEVQVAVSASVLNASYAERPSKSAKQTPDVIGFSGVITEHGKSHSEFVPGEQVFGLTCGSISNFSNINSNLIVKKPVSLSLSQAAACAAPFLIAYGCLCDITKAKAGETVLLQNAADSTTLAVLQIAKKLKIIIIATASDASERAHLMHLGADHVLDHNEAGYADAVKKLTDGNGVDVVLNSLHGDFIATGLSFTKVGGRFVELGSNGVWSYDEVRQAYPDLEYTVYSLIQTIEAEPEKIGRYLHALCNWYECGDYSPPAVTSFKMEDAPTALLHLKQSMPARSLVLTTEPHRSSKRFEADATYLVTGGTGGMGLEIANWLVAQGAANIVLIGRREPDAQTLFRLEQMRAQGAAVYTYSVDVGDRNALAKVLDTVRLQLPALKGIFHAAGVLSSGALAEQTWQDFRDVFRAKVDGSWNLHELTLHESLDYFVLCSSFASVLVRLLSGNYAAANAFMDCLAHHRQTIGKAGLSINWGAWTGVGMANLATSNNSGLTRGMTAQQALACLGMFLANHDGAQIAIANMEWPTSLENVNPLICELITQSKRVDRANSFELLKSLEAAESRDSVAGILRQQIEIEVRNILKLRESEEFDGSLDFFALGMDSLMAVELSNRIQNALAGRVNMSGAIVYNHPDAIALSEYVAHHFQMAQNALHEERIVVVTH